MNNETSKDKFEMALEAQKQREATPLQSQQTKRCSDCGRVLPFSMFYNRTKSKDGLQHICKDCTAERHARTRDKANTARLAKLDFKVAHPLSAYTPRELMDELRQRGYRGKLEYVQTIII